MVTGLSNQLCINKTSDLKKIQPLPRSGESDLFLKSRVRLQTELNYTKFCYQLIINY